MWRIQTGHSARKRVNAVISEGTKHGIVSQLIVFWFNSIPRRGSSCKVLEINQKKQNQDIYQQLQRREIVSMLKKSQC